ncbi:hypothetical protein [Parapedobacter sp. 10938]|uniref:hypothetical protein n=1 Tax=Parapedobacter flavus TaxID=3110225 RepID=UPI002DBF0882|nr:hypothetical protein [Parapedobacter sp. 10938]MEC3881900.1 hypothetical protein [Parapedobacter sp. 10938]
MTIPLPTDILNVPIDSIPELSRNFRASCRACGFHTLQDICRLGAAEASKTRYLGPDLFRELTDFLHARRILHTLRA